MAMEKIAVFSYQNGNTIFRSWTSFKASRDRKLIEVLFEEWVENQEKEIVAKPVIKMFCITNEPEYIEHGHTIVEKEKEFEVALPNTKDPFKQKVKIPEVEHTEKKVYDEFKGFDKWYDMDLSGINTGTLGGIITDSINTVLRSLPLDVPSGYLYNPKREAYESTKK